MIFSICIDFSTNCNTFIFFITDQKYFYRKNSPPCFHIHPNKPTLTRTVYETNR